MFTITMIDGVVLELPHDSPDLTDPNMLLLIASIAPIETQQNAASDQREAA
jgi:hypothetical protein